MRNRVLAALALSASAPAAAQSDYVAFCTGIAVGASGNKMFFSRPFVIAQNAAPPAGQLSDPNPADAFAAEVKKRSSQELIGASCPTRPSETELTEFITTTQSSNSASWAIETIEWVPKGARRVGEPAADITTSVAPVPVHGPVPGPVPAPASAPGAAAEARRTEALRRAAERAEAVARAKVARQAVAQAEGEAIRAANAQQAEVAESQRRKFAAERAAYQAAQQNFEAKQRDYEVRQRAYVEAKAKHDAQVRAAEEAYKQWEADVACKSGQRALCAPKS